jgi:hypothetical protein
MSHAYNHYKKAVELELEQKIGLPSGPKVWETSTLVSLKLLNKIILIMTKTALITGATSGIGKDHTAFSQKQL